MSRLSVILTILLCSIVAQFTVAAEIGTHNYDIYVGDINSDGYSDFYFHGKPLTLILHGDIATPIVLTAPVSFVIYRNYSDYDTPVAYSLSFLQVAAKVAAGELKLYKIDYDFFIWNNGTSGQNNILLRGHDSFAPALSLSSFSTSAFPLLTQTYRPSGYSNISNRSLALVIQDINYDGRKDIVIGSASSATGEYAYVADSSGVPVTQTRELTPSTDQPIAANATHVGSTAGQFRVDESGAATYNIPISLPEGVAGVTPQLSLGYSSQGGNGIAGMGWSLGGLSSITRCRQTLSQDNSPQPITWSASDRFCLDGQRLMLVSGIYGSADSTYRTELDSFVVVTAKGGTAGHPAYFTAEAKDGSTSVYGNTTNSKVTGTVANTTLTWTINRFQDNVGNSIDFVYEGNGASGQRIKTIHYAFPSINSSSTQAARTDSAARVVFDYEARQDISSGYVAGHSFGQDKRLKQITVINDGAEVRRYNLSYMATTTADSRYKNVISRLQFIQECRQVDSTSLACLPAKTFAWGGGSHITLTQPLQTIDFPNPTDGKYVLNSLFSDVSGNGKLDLIYLMYEANEATAALPNKAQVVVRVRYAENSIASALYLGTVDSYHRIKISSLDYNADGRQDLALYNGTHWKIYLSTVRSDGSWRIDSSSSIVNLTTLTDIKTSFADLDSNGLVDLVTDGSYRLLERNAEPNTSNKAYSFSASAFAFQWDPVSNFPQTLDLPPPSFTGVGQCTHRGYVAKILPHSMGDFNGDGVVDFIGTYSRQFNCTVFGNPTVLQTDAHYALAYRNKVLTNYSHIPNDQMNVDYSLDLNGDDLTDHVYRLGQNQLYYRLNNGQGFENAVPWIELPTYSTSPTHALPQFLDFNGDGATDIVWHNRSTGQLLVRLWGSNESTVIRTVSTGLNDSHMLMDVTGDGIFDYIKITSASLSGARGVMAVAGAPIPCHYVPTPPSSKCVGGNPSPSDPVPSDEQHDGIISIENGLGNLTKIIYGTLSNSGHYSTTDVNPTITETEKPIPCSGATSCPPTYTDTTADPSDFYARLNGGWSLPASSKTLVPDNTSKGAPVLEINGSMQIVTEVQSSAPIAADANARSRVSYYYREAKMQASGRGFLGFNRLLTVDQQTGITTTTTYRQDFPFNGQPLRTTVHSDNSKTGKILSYAENEWDFKYYTGPDNTRRYQPYIKKSTEQSYALKANGAEQGELLQTVTTANEYYDDQYGNLKDITVTTAGGAHTLVKKTSSTYRDDDWEKRMGRLTKVEVTTNDDISSKRVSSFEYYSAGETGGFRGLLKKEIVEPGHALSTTTVYTYDGYGNKKSASITALGSSGQSETRTQTSKYKDNKGRYIESTLNDLNQGSKVTQINQFGSPVKVADVTNINTDIFYDAMGSEYMRKDATGAWARTDAVYCGNGVACPSGAIYRVVKKVSGGGKSIAYFDILGRTIRSTTINFDGSEVHVDTEYDNLSRITRHSNPFVGATATAWTTNEYDILGRVIKVTLPDTSIGETEYSGYHTKVINALGQTRTETRNGLGQLTKVTDNLVSSVNGLKGTIDYVYDIHGDLEKATTTADGIAISVRMCYDKFGRKFAMHDPDKGGFDIGTSYKGKTNATKTCAEVASSATTTKLDGWWYYSYNAFGELISQTDAKGQSVRMTYDQLGRMKTRTDIKSNAAIEGYTQWFYDKAEDGSAKLGAEAKPTAIVMNTNGTASVCLTGASNCHRTIYNYDKYGRALNTQVYYPGEAKAYTSSVTYDRYGRASHQYDAIDKVIINNGVAQASGIEIRYNPFGYQEQILDIASGQSLQRTLATNARGQVTKELRGNGATTTNTYDDLTGNLIQQHAGVISPVRLIQNISYRWDKVGNLSYRHNQSASLTGSSKDNRESFCYDGLNRLIKSHQGTLSGSCALSLTQQDMQYDGHGNIKFKQGVGDYSYGSAAGPHAVTATTVDNKIYQYDKNGNMIGDKTGSSIVRSFEYTTYDQAARISKDPDNYTAFNYGPDRNRWERKDVKNSIVTTTRYLGNVERIEMANSGIVEWKRTVAGVIFTYKTNIANTLMANGVAKSFVYNDHLGSLDTITNAVGTVTHSLSFDAWGARRSGENWNNSFHITQLNLAGFSQPITTRGYTGHEMVDDMGLIHMNGRIYDPKLARFMQADPFIQAAANTQSYNRYSYLWNNPLNATDPSGFFLDFLVASKIDTEISKPVFKYLAERPNLALVVQVIGSFVSNYYCGPCSIGFNAQFSKNMSYAQTGSLNSAYRAAATSAATAAVFYAIGLADFGGGPSGIAAQVFVYGMAGGVMAGLQGGNFGHGFASAGLSVLGGAVGGRDLGAQGLVINAIVGGTISKITGGKFASGAQSAAMMYAVMWAGSKIGTGGTTPENKPESSGASCSKNPINIATGEKYLTMTDYRAEGASQMTFERFYSSYAKEKTSLGIGWRSNFDRSLAFEKLGDTTMQVIALRQQDDPIQFDRVFDENAENNQWLTDDNHYEILRKTDSGWELQLTDNTIESYDESGRLISIKHINGYQQTFVYGNPGLAKNVLLSVIDNFGQQLTFTYDLYARISSMTATDGSVTRYQYDSHHNLTKVISPDETPADDWDNQFVVYDYNDERFAHAITGIRNSQGQRIHTMAYDDQGRAVLSALGDDVERVDIKFSRGDNNTKHSLVKNSLGKTTSYTFDADNKPLQVEGNPTATCIGANQDYDYNDKGQLISKTDWNGSTIRYEYNERGLEIARIEAADTAQERRITTQWHSQWRLPTRMTSADLVVEFAYNEQGMLARRVERDTKSELNNWQKLFKQSPEREWNYDYSEQGLLTEVDGPRTDVDDITRFEYDAHGNRTAVINALDHRSETLSFNERGLPLQVRDANGLVTELTYSARGWLISKTVKTEQGDSTTHYDYTGVSDYNDQGVISAVTLPNGAVVNYEYDSARRLIAQSNNAGERIEYSLDLEGNRLEQRIINSTGTLLFSQRQVFDELSRLLQSIGADGSVTRFGYDKAGNLITSADALGNNTAYAYDALNRLIATTDALDGVVHNAYDQANRVTAVTDQRGLVTQYHYDGFGNKVAQISPDTGETIYGYDQAGNLINKKDARNVVTEYRYDAVGRITDVIYPAANDENIHYRYDSKKSGENGIGRVASMVNASGSQAYRYNVLGQLAEQSYDVSNTHYSVSYDYDRAGQLTSLRYPSGRAVSYAYDAQGRLSTVNTTNAINSANVTNEAKEQTLASNIHYLPFGSLKGLTYGNGAQLRIDHDQNYRTRSIQVGSFAANDALYDRHYDYDATSNITAITDRNNAARNQHFNYDAIYRLTNATGSYGQVSYSYDAVGNRIAREQNGRMEAYSYADNSNRLLSVITESEQGELQARNLGYDTVGNIIRDGIAGTDKQLVYNDNNRLQQVAITDKPTSSYEYNAKGQRVIKRVNEKVIHFHYDMADQLIAETQTSGQPIREYIYAAGQRLAMVDYTENLAGVIYYMVNDHLGTPQLLLDAQQKVVWSVDQSPFGEVKVAGSVVQPLRFPGQYADDETGYSYNYFRDYDPTLGRYIQSDPIGLEGGVNTFGYVKGRPTVLVDYFGLLDSWFITNPSYHTTNQAVYAARFAVRGALVAPNSSISYGSVVYQQSSASLKLLEGFGRKPTFWFTSPNPHGSEGKFTDLGNGGIWGAVPVSKIENATAIVMGYRRPDIGDLNVDAVIANTQALANETGLPVHLMLPKGVESLIEPEMMCKP